MTDDLFFFLAIGFISLLGSCPALSCLARQNRAGLLDFFFPFFPFMLWLALGFRQIEHPILSTFAQLHLIVFATPFLLTLHAFIFTRSSGEPLLPVAVVRTLILLIPVILWLAVPSFSLQWHDSTRVLCWSFALNGIWAFTTLVTAFLFTLRGFPIWKTFFLCWGLLMANFAVSFVLIGFSAIIADRETIRALFDTLPDMPGLFAMVVVGPFPSIIIVGIAALLRFLWLCLRQAIASPTS